MNPYDIYTALVVTLGVALAAPAVLSYFFNVRDPRVGVASHGLAVPLAIVQLVVTMRVLAVGVLICTGTLFVLYLLRYISERTETAPPAYQVYMFWNNGSNSTAGHASE